MTEFQKKRLEYLIKAAEKCEYVQLGHGDADWLIEAQDALDEIAAMDVVVEAIRKKG